VIILLLFSSFFLYRWIQTGKFLTQFSFLSLFSFFISCFVSILGGNQRDLAREKNQKKQADAKKKQGASAKEGNKGMTLEERKARDADMMRLKQKKAEEKATAPK